MSKPYLNYNEQIAKLESKNMIINDRDFATNMLKRYGYYSLICGYKEPFKNKTTGKYVDGVRFEEIINLYEFDSSLREVFLKYLLIVEKRLKECLSNAFCSRYSESQNEYLDANNYEYSTPKNRKDINELISRLQKLTQSNKYPYIIHARKEYGNVPLWVLFKAVPFGTASIMYKLQKQSIKVMVAKEYDALNEGNLESLLQLVSGCRNVCAHSERLYTFRTKESIPIIGLHNKLKIMRIGNGNECCCGQKDLFAVVISLRYLLDDVDFKRFFKQLECVIDEYIKNISVSDSHIEKKQVLKSMGFPDNWKSIIRYRQ